MTECFKETTDQSLVAALNAHSPKLWSQIHSAFDVRHLIEHRKGHVDRRFLAETSTHNLWKRSSWADLRLSAESKIEVREKDFDVTCDAMVTAAGIIAQLTAEFWIP
jgi:hypothetical protein